MSSDGAWYGGDGQQPEAPHSPAQQPLTRQPLPQQRSPQEPFAQHADASPSFADAPTAPQPLVPVRDGFAPQQPPAHPPAQPQPLPPEPVAEQLSDPLPEDPAPEPPRRTRDLGAGIAIAIVILMVLCIGAVGSSFQVFTRTADDFEAGACVAPEPKGEPPYRVAECADPAAAYTVVTVLDRDAQRPCRDVAGASALFSTDESVVCLGRKGVDRARAVNVAKEGDCVTVEGRDAMRLDCRDPGAKFQVVKRLTDVAESATGGACAGVQGVVETYSWNWTSSDPIDRLDKAIDVVLCLGPSQSAIEAAASASAARSNCRFLTDAEISAAVSATTGKTYTVTRRVDDGTFCGYQFSKPTEVVRVGFAVRVKAEPGTASETFTLDGLKAMWTPGEGDRSLSVEMPSGLITINVQLAGVGDTTSRRLAVAAFKSARPRVA